MPDTAPTLVETVSRVSRELKDEGKSNVSIDNEAQGSKLIATRILESAAASLGLEVQTRVNKKSVSAKVVESKK